LQIIFGSIFNIYHGTPILCCTTTDLEIFWYCFRDFRSCICESPGGNALFFRWLLSLYYIINIWSYSSHLHHMLLRGPSEKVLISRFVERKSKKRDCSV